MGKLVFKRGALDRLKHESRVQADLLRRGAAIRDACNGESSWGGYEMALRTEGKLVAVNVWSISAHARADNARSNRLVNNLDVGRS